MTDNNDVWVVFIDKYFDNKDPCNTGADSFILEYDSPETMQIYIKSKCVASGEDDDISEDS